MTDGAKNGVQSNINPKVNFGNSLAVAGACIGTFVLACLWLSGSQACNANEDFDLSQQRVGYSDWSVQYGWYILNSTHIDVISGEYKWRCNKGTMEQSQRNKAIAARPSH